MDTFTEFLIAEQTISMMGFLLYSYLFWASGYMSLMWKMAKSRRYGFTRTKLDEFEELFK